MTLYVFISSKYLQAIEDFSNQTFVGCQNTYNPELVREFSILLKSMGQSIGCTSIVNRKQVSGGHKVKRLWKWIN